MPSRFPQADLSQVRTTPLQKRQSKVSFRSFARPPLPGASFQRFIDSLPDILIGHDWRAIVGSVVSARRKRKPVLWMMGAHVIKCGLSPVLIDLMERKVITALAMNGATAIHDTEVAFHGETSEDVAAGLEDGRFGMARDTGEIIHGALRQGAVERLGFGESLGRSILERKMPHRSMSVLAAAYALGVPATVHVALGADIIHQHPRMDGGITGEASLHDFRVLCEVCAGLGQGGVVFNVGSSVMLPEVFLKALNVARNLHGPVRNFTAVNFDMIQHYRPRQNVLLRPTAGGGRSFAVTGHHELLVPLLAQSVVERLKGGA